MPTLFGRTPLELLLGPWTLTFEGVPRSYRVILEGELGLALLLLLPLALLPPVSRPKTFLALAVAASYLGWTFSGQTGRHLLPTLALAAALLAGSVATLPPPSAWPTRLAAVALRTGLLAASLASLLFFLPNATTRLPVELLLGRQSAEAFLAEQTWAAAALAATTSLPPDTRVGYISLWEGPQAATEARLVFLGTFPSPGLAAQLGATPQQILASLQAQGLRYLLWDRTNTGLEDWASPLLASDFLRTHARILAGDANAYLLEILPQPDPDRAWGLTAPTALLANPDFRRLTQAGSPWVLTPPDAKVSREDGALLLRRAATLSQTVPVTADQPYLLTARMTCPELGLAPTLTLLWHDAAGSLLRTDSEPVYPGPTPSTQFVWRVAPAAAATVTVQLSDPWSTTCRYEEVNLYDAS